MTPFQKQSRSGLSLIETLVTVAIIAILLTLLMPVMSRSKAKAKDTQCQNNLRQLFLMITAYADDNQDSVPHASYHITNHPALLACPNDAYLLQRTNPPWTQPSSYNFNSSWKLKELPASGWLATEFLPWHDSKATWPDPDKGIDRPSGYHNHLRANGHVDKQFLGDNRLKDR